jgi:cytochrome c peroxidase
MCGVKKRVALIFLLAACGQSDAVITGANDAIKPPGDTSAAAPLARPVLPATPYAYSDGSAPLVRWYAGVNDVSGADNTPASNRITDAGATLGRVLFYDRRLSSNNRIACASCHQQQFGFGDTARASRGFNGGLTARHAMGLGNARFYARGRFFWDERAATLEEQVLQPIQNSVEMGMTLQSVVARISAVDFYPPLFMAVFGSADVTSERMALALAQFVRSLTTSSSSFDAAFATNGELDVARLTPQQQEGLEIFRTAECDECHGTNANISDNVHNNGLDAAVTDAGAGGGRFKAPSLRNVAVRGRYMHDGRFKSLGDVVFFYNSGVQNNPNLDPRLRARGAAGVRRLNLSATQQQALVAYLESLTDSTFLHEAKFSDPFPH